MHLTIAELNNQYLNVLGLIDGTTRFLADGVTINSSPTYINNASGTVQIVDSAGTPQIIGVASATSAPLAYVAGTNGNYRALITSAFNAPAGRTYTAIIDLTSPGGFVGHWEIPVAVKARTQ